MPEDDTTFQRRMIALVRAFGWHRPDRTPCGRPVPIAEAHALVELGQTPAMTQQELARALNLGKSTVSRLVATLESRGWVDRTRNSLDGRAWDVALTRAGHQAAAELARARKTRMDAILERIPSEQRATVVRSLETLIGAIHESNE